MAKKVYEEQNISNIAAAIRNKTGSDKTYKPSEMAESIDEVYEAGKEAQYNAFWDIYQQNGQRTNYSLAFNGAGWTNEIFKPKYPLKPTSMEAMFQYSNLTEIGYEPEIDFTDNTSVYTCFRYSKVEKIKLIDISDNTAGKNLMCGYCKSLHTIETLKVTEKTTFTQNMFQDCTALKTIKINGAIGQNDLILQWSTELSKTSIYSIITALSGTATGKTITLSKTAVKNAFGITGEIINTNPECDEWFELIATKSNWAISLL